MRTVVALLLSFQLLPAGRLAADPVADEAAYLGEMTGFYRNTAVLDRTLAKSGMMWAIPEWMGRTDFPYKKKPFAKELPFTDACTVVRLLGGWMEPKKDPHRADDENDLAGRDENGKIFYRWDLLKERLDPYVEQGYGLTLVLDNSPHCFAPAGEADSGKHFGQVTPPRDMKEWYAFVRAMCEEIKRLYGEEFGNQLRFRMGTEMQDDRRFNGTFEQYCQVYDFAAKAVRDVFPKAKFGPYNRSIPKGSFENFQGLVSGNVSFLKLAEHCATGVNHATGEIGAPFDFAPRSFYYFSFFDKDGKLDNVDPDQRLPEFLRMWEAIEKLSPRYRDLPREVQEYGAHLSTEEGIYGLDTGARGAAQNLDTLIGLKEIGTDRIWHWEVFEEIAPDKTLLMSQGWLYSVMERMRGGKLYSLPVSQSRKTGNRARAWLSIKENEAILMVSHWHVDRVIQEQDDLTIRLPEVLAAGSTTIESMLQFTEANSVFDVIRDDLKEAGLLSNKHVDHRGEPATTVASGGYHNMASDRQAGRRFVAEGWPKYLELMQDSLKLKPFKGDFSKGQLMFSAPSPSVTVVVFKR